MSGEPEAQSGHTPRILVVDDNPSALYVTGRVLRSAGFETFESSSGSAALALAPKADLVVLDINLPDIDGYEVCRRLRASPQTRNMPVLHLSATFVGDGDVSTGLAAGADGFLTRPVEPAVLLATVRTMLFARTAEQVRRATDAKFHTTFELAPTGIAILDAQLRIESANLAFCELAGFPSAEIIGRSCHDFVLSGARTLSDLVTQQADDPGPWVGTSSLLRKDASVVEVEWRIAIEPESGIRVLVGTDITRRLRAQVERDQLLAAERAARAEAERSNRLKDEFLATLSHELRNPLNAILGWTAVLRKARNLNSPFAEGLAAIERNSRLQAQLIGDLLDYAGITFGKLRVDPVLIDPHVTLTAALAVIQRMADDKQVQLHARFTDQPVRILADPSRMQQVAWNLLANAIKFSEPGGEVTVTTSVEVGYVELCVIDRGKGIRPDFLPHLFDRFSQEDASTTRQHGGLGIGLAIVESLVRLHGGTVRATSAGIGQGASFTVRIPLADDAATTLASAAPESSTPTSLAGVVVMLVEDDTDTRVLTRRILEEAGASVIEAGDVDAALRLLDAQEPHVLISDIGMAQRDGYELLRTLRAGGRSAATLPAIAFTAFARAEDREHALAAGFQLHLPKPIEPAQLVRAVAALLAPTP